MKHEELKVLVACEESQAVCIEFRKLGIEAYSNDLIECSGGYPEWHLKMDCFAAIEKVKPNLMIGFPPCTRLTVTANKWYKPEYSERFPNIHIERERGKEFFMNLINADVRRIAIENPIGIMSTFYRKPDQIIQPFYFGDKSRKSTCLWLKNLPKLYYSTVRNIFSEKTTVEPEIYTFKNGKGTCSMDYIVALKAGPERAKIRSKTFPGIAKAMATQWTDYILNQK